MTESGKSKKELLLEMEELKSRLAEAEDTLRAIREGEVDAVIGASPEGDRIYTLQGAEHPYRIFFEAMDEGAVTMTFDGTILYCNRRFADLAKVPLEKVMGMPFLDFIVEDSRQTVSALLSETGPERRAIESSLVVQGDGVVPVNISLNPLRTKDMEAVCAVVTDLSELVVMRKLEEANDRLVSINKELRASQEELQASESRLRASRRAALNVMEDAVAAGKRVEEASIELRCEISDRKKAEEDVLKLSGQITARNAELEDANRELESFIYSVSHDLRAPLRSISTFASFLGKDYSDRLDDKAKDYLGRVITGTAKMSRLIDDMLHLSKISRQEVIRKVIDISRVAWSVISDFREAEPGRKVEVVIMEGLTASADPRLMEMVFSNLLGNAWKFTSKMENARIELGTIENPPLHPSREGTIYFVKDNGAGFDPKYAEKMFLPFHRLHSGDEFEGTGIGLAIVERIIRRHGGNIWAEGEPGKGATVYFTLG